MTPLGFLAVGIGAAFGAWLRWIMGVGLNAIMNNLPLGTLLANLGGGYLIGMAVAFFSSHPELSPEWKLLLITGFLGGLTTFSTFSAEAMGLIQRGDMLWAFLHSAMHLFGSILCCFAGFATYRVLQ
ncbi:MAG: fluoride efflux transporter CrcB [Burkholderiaceae bacterium]|nr:fluoride efflux transporter CrcB [Burkholderiaceae bacterium]